MLCALILESDIALFFKLLLLTQFKEFDDVQLGAPMRSEIQRFGAVTTSGRGLVVILVKWRQSDVISFWNNYQHFEVISSQYNEVSLS